MLRALLLTFAVILLSIGYPIHLDWLLGAQAQEDDMLEILKQIEIQKIKSRILRELGITKVPVFYDSPSSLSPEVIKMLLSDYKEEELSIEQNENTPKLMIFPENVNFKCEWMEDSSCRRFEYNLSPNAVISSSEFWLRKLKSSPGNSMNISVLCSDSEQILINKTNQVFSGQNAEKKWEIYQLSALKKLPSRRRKVTCEIETSGIAVDDDKHNLPFLKMNEERSKRQRKRRNEDSIVSPNTCRAIPFNFSFDALGIANHIHHPHWFMSNICDGHCNHAQNDHEILMEMYFRHHPELNRRYSRCWQTCCKPVEYRTMKLIYDEVKDNKTIVMIRNFTNAIVTRCACS